MPQRNHHDQVIDMPPAETTIYYLPILGET